MENFNNDWDLENVWDDTPQSKDCSKCLAGEVQTKSIKRKWQHQYRRAFSESKLLDMFDHDMEKGASYHVLSGGDVDAMSYLKSIVRQQDLEYVLFSTWCMADDDVEQLRTWIDSGKIKRVDAYCGEIFPKSYRKQHKSLSEVVTSCGGRVAIFRNHSKIFAGVGKKFAFGIESSANINTNPRTENTTITIDDGIFEFYKEFFDGVKSFNRDFDEWQPWKK